MLIRIVTYCMSLVTAMSVLLSCTSGNTVVEVISGNSIMLASGEVVRLANVDDTPENYDFMVSNILWTQVIVVEESKEISDYITTITGKVYTSDSKCINDKLDTTYTDNDNIRHHAIKTTHSREILTSSDIFEKLSPAVFKIYTATDEQCFQGSGFFISSNGVAVSNYHVFQGSYVGFETIILQDGEEYKISDIYFRSEEKDVIIFKVNIDKPVRYIPIASCTPKVGERIYTISSPRGLYNTFSSGEVSQIRENGGILQINAPIDHGSSGGVLLNTYGEAVGITTGGYDDSGANLNFAINIQIIKPELDKLRQ